MKALIEKTEAKFQETFPDFKTDPRDLDRIATAASLVVGKTMLDIGSGPGLLVNCLADTNNFTKITSFDISNHSKRIVHPNVKYLNGDIRNEYFNPEAHETVCCMEVLEHCESKYNPIMLNNVRRAATRRAIFTVPYSEPEPLWWHDRPGGHRQRFTLPKLAKLFPNAFATIIPRYGIDWVLIAEDRSRLSEYFHIMDRETFSGILK